MTPEIFSLICFSVVSDVAVVAVASARLRRIAVAIPSGWEIDATCRWLVRLAREEWRIVTTDFNGVRITARPWSISSHLSRECQRGSDT